MDAWVRNLVMLVVTFVWAVVVLTSLFRGILPDAITWGVPGAVWFALNPTMPTQWRRSAPDKQKTGDAA